VTKEAERFLEALAHWYGYGRAAGTTDYVQAAAMEWLAGLVKPEPKRSAEDVVYQLRGQLLDAGLALRGTDGAVNRTLEELLALLRADRERVAKGIAKMRARVNYLRSTAAVLSLESAKADMLAEAARTEEYVDSMESRDA
jgi:hypothetical protein